VKKLIEKEFQYCLKLSLQPLTDATIIGITGSNGKTTTTMLTYHVLKSAGLNVGLGGNIERVLFGKLQITNMISMLELSSFQLDGVVNFATYCYYQY
jgi:UDP-N-acetylmuramoylalanine--D-glutamate ligase